MKMSANSRWTAVWALALVVVPLHLCVGQFFDPKMADDKYLDSLESTIVTEVQEAKIELIEEANVIQDVTRNFIAAQIKRNMFKALRVLAEKELSLTPRQPRQEEESGGDEETDSNTTRRPSQLLPQAAALIKAVFGGNINLTSYVESASSLLPKPIATQLVGVVKLLANNPGYKYTSTTSATTVASVTTRAAEAGVSAAALGSTVADSASAEPSTEAPTKAPTTTATTATTTTKATTTTPATTTEDEDDTEEEFGELNDERQLQIPGLDILGSLVNAVTNNNNNNRNQNKVTTSNVASVNNQAANNDIDILAGVGQAINGAGQVINNAGQTAGQLVNNAGQALLGGGEGSRPSNGNSNGNAQLASTNSNNNQQLNGIDVNGISKEIRNGLGDIIKIMPDIFRGAHEAYKLLSTVSGLFSGLDSA